MKKTYQIEFQDEAHESLPVEDMETYSYEVKARNQEMAIRMAMTRIPSPRPVTLVSVKENN